MNNSEVLIADLFVALDLTGLVFILRHKPQLLKLCVCLPIITRHMTLR